MHSKTIFAPALAVAALLLLVVVGASAQGTLHPKEDLGKNLLFDTNLFQVAGGDRSFLQYEGRSRRGMAAARSGRQHQHSRDGESWTEPRAGACHRRVPEDPLRWLHAQEVAGKLQSPGMPFPQMLRVAAQARPYLDWRWTGPAPCGRSPPGARR